MDAGGAWGVPVLARWRAPSGGPLLAISRTTRRLLPERFGQESGKSRARVRLGSGQLGGQGPVAVNQGGDFPFG